MNKNNDKKADNVDIDILKSKIKDIKIIIQEYDVSPEHISARSILEKMMEILEQYIKIVIQIMQPEEFFSLHECTIFDDTDKAKMFVTYKDMMILHREMLKSLIKNDEKDIITTITYAHSEINNLKPEIVSIVQKMQDSWKKTGTNSRMKYFG